MKTRTRIGIGIVSLLILLGLYSLWSMREYERFDNPTTRILIDLSGNDSHRYAWRSYLGRSSISHYSP
jgi:hypothetical protein